MYVCVKFPRDKKICEILTYLKEFLGYWLRGIIKRAIMYESKITTVYILFCLIQCASSSLRMNISH